MRFRPNCDEEPKRRKYKSIAAADGKLPAVSPIFGALPRAAPLDMASHPEAQ
jgi:hypothetical protein